jgi:hypothetical protein
MSEHPQFIFFHLKPISFDAWSVADALRVDGHGWKVLTKEDPLVTELRLLCRDEVGLQTVTLRIAAIT